MEVCCSFKTIVGGICGPDSRDEKQDVTVIPLVSCTRDITKHLRSFAFSGPENEIDLILSRAAIFKIPVDVNDMTICPFHRGKLGLGHRIGKEQKAHSFDLFDAAATRRNAHAPTAAMLLARSSQPDQ